MPIEAATRQRGRERGEWVREEEREREGRGTGGERMQKPCVSKRSRRKKKKERRKKKEERGRKKEEK